MEPDAPARVVIDEVSGVVVMGDDVRVSTVAIAQGNLTISVQETPQVSQPAPFSQGQTTVVPQSQISVKEEKGKQLLVVGGGASLASPGAGAERAGRHPARHDFHPAGDQGRRRPASRHRGDVMDTLALATAPIDILAGSSRAPATAAEMAKRGDIAKTAADFESTFLSTMLQTMFQGVTTSPPFGGGAGEDMWKSFMAAAMAKQMTKAGGIGVSKAVAREMLSMQGLSEKPQ